MPYYHPAFQPQKIPQHTENAQPPLPPEELIAQLSQSLPESEQSSEAF